MHVKKLWNKFRRWYDWHKRKKCNTCLYLKCVSNWSPCYECKYYDKYERDETVDYDDMLKDEFVKATNEDILQEIKKLQDMITKGDEDDD